MSVEIIGAVQAARTAFGLVKTAIEARDDSKVKAALVDMGERLMDVTMAGTEAASKLSSATMELHELRQKLRDAEARQQERERYVLTEVAKGAYALRFQTREDDVTPAHYACQVCMDSGHRSVMQAGELFGVSPVLLCPRSKEHTVAAS